ncbi:MAG: hypothetical protein F6K11_15555, partial [Leptolyngbya sp. SIO3F4]|nr:hypothetical protein [Leptolyngbya sp. SIO3F4]
TGTQIGSNPTPVDPVEPIDPLTPVDPITPVEPVAPVTTNSNVDFDIINDWGSGYQGQVKVTNNDNSPINSWTLEFDFSGKITQIWNAQIVNRNGNTYVVSNASYNGAVAPGQEVSFGFLGEGSTSQLPNLFKLNGNLIGSNLIATADEVDASIFEAVDDATSSPVQTADLGSPMEKVSAPTNEEPTTESLPEPDFVGTNKNNVINGNNKNNFIFGLAGNDRIKARKGNDTINGGLGNDRLWGNLGDDTLKGDAGNDTLWGGRGSDNLVGGLNNDVLVGSGYFRQGDNSSDVDTFTGGKGADKFVLGNRRHIFYTLGGDEDYAWITDLNTSEGDTIQLNDQFSYNLGAAPEGTAKRQGLLVEKNGNQELIAVIQSDSTLTLSDRTFIYV